MAVEGLPATFTMKRGEPSKSIEGLSVAERGDLLIDVVDASGRSSAAVIRCASLSHPALKSYWCDLHGQSEETIGTNSARELIEFARDKAFLDGMSHQGNDFQITTPFWNELNVLTAEYNKPTEFHHLSGLRMVGQHRLGRRPQRDVYARRPADPSFEVTR